VIGVGSPHGDDAAGLAVAERLAGRLPADVEILARDRPGLDLVLDLRGADAVVIVDAVRGGEGPPGSVRRVAPDRLASRRELSTHALGVADALALAKALGSLPPRLGIVTVEAGDPPGDAHSDALSHAVAAALHRACDEVRRTLRQLDREAQ
jgi:hydrogenase maturation protease